MENPDSEQLPPVTEEPQTGAPVGTETEVQEQPTEVLPPPEPLPKPTKEFITVGDDYFRRRRIYRRFQNGRAA